MDTRPADEPISAWHPGNGKQEMGEQGKVSKKG
jgi:hypothetical protein